MGRIIQELLTLIVLYQDQDQNCFKIRCVPRKPNISKLNTLGYNINKNAIWKPQWKCRIWKRIVCSISLPLDFNLCYEESRLSGASIHFFGWGGGVKVRNMSKLYSPLFEDSQWTLYKKKSAINVHLHC